MKEPFDAILIGLVLLALANPAAGICGPTTTAPVKPEKKAAAQKLRRADFRITGASCVACLRRIGKTIREQKGVMKGDVSIFKPYWAIIIYDAGQTSLDKVLSILDKEKEKVKVEDIEDRPIGSLPGIVIPKGIDGKSGGAGSGASP